MLCADLTVDANIGELGAFIEQQYKSIDILIHSAGFFSMGSIREAALEDFDRHFRTNVRAPYALTKALLPLLRPGKGRLSLSTPRRPS